MAAPQRPCPLALASAIALALGLFTTAARADIISDEEGACRGREAGAPCNANGKDGTCAKSTCSRNRFDGEKHSVEQVDCLLCAPGPKQSTPAKTDPGPPEPGKVDPPDPSKPDPSAPPASDEPPAKVEPAEFDPPAIDPPKPDPGKLAPSLDPPKTDPQKPGCMGTIDAPSTTLGSLVLGVVLFGLARRRRVTPS